MAAVDDARRRVLALTLTAQDARATCEVLGSAAIAVSLCASMPELYREIQIGAGAVLLADKSLEGQVGALAAVLDRQAKWSDLPIVVLASGGVDSPLAMEALQTLPNLLVLDRPVHLPTLVSAVRMALRSRQRQYELRDHLEERQRAEDSAAKLQRKLDSALLAGEVATFEWRVPEDRVWGDRNFTRIFGVPPDSSGTAPLGKYVQAIHPDDRAHMMERLNRTLATGCPYEAEYRIIRQGQTRWVVARGTGERDESGQVARFLGVIVEITERKQAEKALRQVVHRYEQQVRLFDGVASTTPDFVFLFDPQGRFVYANRCLLDVWGMQLPEVIGKTCLQLGYEQWHHDLHMREIAQIIETRRPIKGEVPFKAPLTGIFGVYEYIFTPVIGPDGEVELIAGTTRDVTERKRTEEALREAQQTLEEADRRKDEFLAMLGHELRNPLAAITSGLQLLRSPEPQEQQWITESLQRQTRQLVSLVDDLLDISRISRGKIQLKPQVVDLQSLLQQAAEATADLIAERRHALNVSATAEQLLVFADPTRLQQIITNLLSNAAKYTPEGGRIVLSLSHEESSAVIRVKDNGLGIPPDMQESIFDLFGQVDSAMHCPQQGLGIGLNLVKSLVELHDGTIAVSSPGLGAGSEFTVRLPVLSGTVAPETPSPQQGSSEDVPLDILLVEDNRDAARMLCSILRQKRHRVRHAEDAQRGIELAAQHQPDLVLLDIGLPDRSGYEVAETLRQDRHYRDCLIVALTGYGQERDRQRSQTAGIDHHLVKPVDYETLMMLVREWLRTAAGRRRLAARRPDTAERPEAARPTRILIIDDMPAIAQMTQRVLQQYGHHVQVALDGPSGIDAAREFRPELVLCDINLPGASGYEVLRTLKADPDFQDTLIAAVTGYDGQEHRQRTAEAGFSAHLVKPVNFECLQELIARVSRQPAAVE